MAKVTKLLTKIDPFSYPSKLHVREERPARYSRYQAYKPALTREFRGQCVYCLSVMMPEESGRFCVEHYRPKSKFPLLAVEYSNLLLACDRCNLAKSDYWSDKQDEKILNPCEDKMSQHLTTLKDYSINPNSKRGKRNVVLLNLDREGCKRQKQMLMRAAKGAIEKIFELKRTQNKSIKHIRVVQELVSDISLITGLSEAKLNDLLLKK